MFHKPKGPVVTLQDELGRRTVYDLLPAWVRKEGWVPVGRLDMDSRGLLFMTRDGWIVDELTRPGAFEKEYEVWVRGRVTPAHAEKLLEGVHSSEGKLKAHGVELRGGIGARSRVYVTLKEGRNRQIRRMFSALIDDETGRPLKVADLKRIRIGPIRLDIPSGAWRLLEKKEISLLGLARRSQQSRSDPNC